jgi:hypothetical protein
LIFRTNGDPMSLHFPYYRFQLGSPIWPLGGLTYRPQPLAHVTLLGPQGTRVRRAVLDTAADDTVFAAADAAAVGIDLTNAPVGQAQGVGRVPALLLYAQVTLRMTDGVVFREWPARVGFTAVPLIRPLLGYAGCLQFFAALFLGDQEEVELTVNSRYPGT